MSSFLLFRPKKGCEACVLGVGATIIGHMAKEKVVWLVLIPSQALVQIKTLQNTNNILSAKVNSCDVAWSATPWKWNREGKLCFLRISEFFVVVTFLKLEVYLQFLSSVAQALPRKQ